MIEKDGDGATESLIHKHCPRSVPNSDSSKRVNSSKALGAVGAPKEKVDWRWAYCLKNYKYEGWVFSEVG